MLSLQHSANGLILAYFGPDDVNTAIDFAHDTAERFRAPVNQYLPPHLYQPMPSAIGDSDNSWRSWSAVNDAAMVFALVNNKRLLVLQR